jgi:hypothetical protein
MSLGGVGETLRKCELYNTLCSLDFPIAQWTQCDDSSHTAGQPLPLCYELDNIDPVVVGVAIEFWWGRRGVRR